MGPETFLNSLDAFIRWKRQKGFYTKSIITTENASDSEIKAIIKEEYTKNNFRYVLLVGDHEHIPAISLPTGMF
ncbi:MAG: hypothetical protein IPO21_02950 [Bacteroidales bacterium]|nr:hypothetical protein [Bacteroidales bacterium]